MPRLAEDQLEAAREEMNGKMAPQMEQLRWQARQAQKRIEELQAAQQEAAAVRDSRGSDSLRINSFNVISPVSAFFQ